MRINRYLAECGIASRRKSEQLILSGAVTLNGREIKDLSIQVQEGDIVLIDGENVSPIKKHIYLMLNKPKGYISSTFDEHGRKTVLDLVSAYRDKRLFPVGRLDYDSEGLLLLTTDGEFMKKLTHPSYEVSKTYIVKILGEISEDELDKLRAGIVLDGVKTNKSGIVCLGFNDGESRVEIVLTEGRNRQVRRMFESIGKEVVFLKRVGVGGLRLGGLSRGEYRELTPKDMSLLLGSKAKGVNTRQSGRVHKNSK